MDVVVWLRSLGLEEYEEAFRDNKIDERVLPNLTQEDLKEIGVGPVGHRRILLDAIEALRTDGGSKAASVDAASASSAPNAPPEDRAERRQLTVMFCDLVGSTALSAKLDPEDMRDIIRAYQDACSGAVALYDGLVAKFMGDGILAYFGYPRAHEDDAERAARTGLDIIVAVEQLRTQAPEPLKVRIGIATGLVVVGDLIGEGGSREQAVVGDTPNLAARLQALAEPGIIVVAASTRRLLRELFKLRDLGRHQVKGLSEPVNAWAVEGLLASDSRFEAIRTARLTGFVGREREIDALRDRQRQAWQGIGQIVLISGEAGVGKSRLASSLGERVSPEPHTRLRYQCSPYHANSALYPFIAQLERVAGIRPDDAAGQKLDKLEAVLATGTSGITEAIAHLRKGVDLAEGLNDGPSHRLLSLRLQTIYGQACFHAQGLASPEATAAYARARELARRVEDPIEKYAAYYGLWAGSWIRGDLPSMREVAEASLSDARRFPGSPVVGIAHRMFGTNLWYEGDFARARSHFEHALAAYDNERDHHLASRFSYDVGIVVMLYLGTTLWPLGEVARACGAANDTLALAVRSGHVPTITLAHATMCFFAAVRRKPDQAALHAQALLGLASKHGLPAMVAFGQFYLGWARSTRGDREGEAEMREGLASIREMDIRTAIPFYSSLVAEVEAKTGRIDTGLATIDAQLETIEQTGERWVQSELYRLRGEFLLERDPPDAAHAEVALACAVNTAHDQKARTFELRAAVSLAKLYQATGRGEASRDLLVQATVGFDEGPEVPEVAEGNRLLTMATGRGQGAVG